MKFFILLIISLAIIKSSLAQYDTVFVYDTVFIQDTIWVNRDTSQINTIQIRLIADLLNKSKINTATFSRNDIIKVNTMKKITDMKKITFISLIALAFQTSLGQGKILTNDYLSNLFSQNHFNFGVHYSIFNKNTHLHHQEIDWMKYTSKNDFKWSINATLTKNISLNYGFSIGSSINIRNTIDVISANSVILDPSSNINFEYDKFKKSIYSLSIPLKIFRRFFLTKSKTVFLSISSGINLSLNSNNSGIYRNSNNSYNDSIYLQASVSDASVSLGKIKNENFLLSSITGVSFSKILNNNNILTFDLGLSLNISNTKLYSSLVFKESKGNYINTNNNYAKATLINRGNNNIYFGISYSFSNFKNK